MPEEAFPIIPFKLDGETYDKAAGGFIPAIRAKEPEEVAADIIAVRKHVEELGGTIVGTVVAKTKVSFDTPDAIVQGVHEPKLQDVTYILADIPTQE